MFLYLGANSSKYNSCRCATTNASLFYTNYCALWLMDNLTTLTLNRKLYVSLQKIVS